MDVVLVCWALAASFKLLLWPAYRSTDFSVHAHWLAITSQMDRKEWYREQTSRWTLDYPPLFAWFEYALSHLPFAPPENLVKLVQDERFDCFRNANNLDANCFSNESVLWHRLTVVLSELIVLGTAVTLYTYTWPQTGDNAEVRFSRAKQYAALLLVAFDPNLLMVDHIHFQYNGLLLGLLVLSITALRMEQDLLGALLFAVLLCFKHIFVYAAPLYFVYLFRRAIRHDGNGRINVSFFIRRIASLGTIVLVVFAASIGSICDTDFECIKAMALRLFPVGERGLLHAYWAPNFWALYAGADKMGKYLLLGRDHASLATSSLGLVHGNVQFDLLPSVPVHISLFLSVVSMLPALYMVWECPHPQLFLHAYIVCVLSFFFFGFHVHEKALLMASLPLALCALDTKFEASAYLCLSAVTFVALAPLLFVIELTPIKLLLASTFALFACVLLDGFHVESKRQRRIFHVGLFWSLLFQPKLRGAYLVGLALVWLFYESGLLAQRLPFLPLMLVSMYCALGVCGCWIELYWILNRKRQAIESYEPK